MFGDSISSSDTYRDTTFADEGGDVGGGEEDESDRKVLDEGDVETVLTAELDISAFEEIERRLQKSALCN
jgi:hypothetical protein